MPRAGAQRALMGGRGDGVAGGPDPRGGSAADQNQPEGHSARCSDETEKESDDEGGWRHTQVTLSSTNPEYFPIILSRRDAEPVQVVAELVTVLRGM